MGEKNSSEVRKSVINDAMRMMIGQGTLSGHNCLREWAKSVVARPGYTSFGWAEIQEMFILMKENTDE